MPAERIIYTFEFEPMAGHILLETITFEEHNGKTRVIDSSVFQTVADRDGMIASGFDRKYSCTLAGRRPSIRSHRQSCRMPNSGRRRRCR